MKRTNYYLVVLLATIAIATSCEKEKEDIGLIPDNDTGVKITLGADASSENTSDSKSTITDLDFAWEAWDELGVSVKSSIATAPVLFILDDDEAGSAQADFSGTLSPSGDGEYIYAVYPYQKDSTFTKTDASIKYTFNLPSQEQRYDTEGILDPASLGDYTYMYGKSDRMLSEVNKVSPIRMRQIMALIDFKITDLPEGIKIDSLSLYAYKGTSFAKSAIVDLDNDPVTAIALKEVDTKPIVVKLKDSAGALGVVAGSNKELTIRLVMFPQTIAQHTKWSVVLRTSLGELVYTKDFTNAKRYQSGGRYTASLGYGMFSKASKVVTIGGLTINDRNQGSNVPTDGFAFNYTNEEGHADHANSAFKGGYYDWAMSNSTDPNDGSCLDPWRLPTKSELEEMKAAMKYNNNTAYIEDKQGQKCYFPFSGAAGSDNALVGTYRSSTGVSDESWTFSVDASKCEINETTDDIGYSVRCVKRDGTSELSTDVSELNYGGEDAEASSVNLTVRGNWRVMTIEDGQIYALKDWITLSPMSGNGDKEISVSVTNNTSSNERSGDIFFKSVDFPNESSVKVTIKQAGSEGSSIDISRIVTIGILTINDRNQGTSVPTDGFAFNYTNDGDHADHANSAFKGGYYDWEAAQTACTAPWRLPTKSELDEMKAAMKYSNDRSYIEDKQGQKCYFPLSGNSAYSSSVAGAYWSSTPANSADRAWHLLVTPSSSSGVHNYGIRSHGFSVRCVKRDGTSELSTDVDELNYGAVSGSSLTEYVTVNSRGKWRVMTVEDGVEYALKGWISLTKMSSDGEASVGVTARNNGLSSGRTGHIFFKSVDFPNELPIQVAVRQEASNYEGLSTYHNLGCGYDGSGEYARQAYVKNQVLDWDKLDAHRFIAPVNNIHDSQSKTISGSSSQEYQKNLSAGGSVSGGYDGLIAGFEASVSATYATAKNEYTETEYASCKGFVKTQMIKLTDAVGAEDLRNCLTDEAYADIVGGKMSAKDVISTYGSFVITGFSIGGVYEYSMSAIRTSSQKNTSLDVAVAASFKSFGGNGSVAADVATHTDLKSNSYSFEESYRTNGGVISNDFNDWSKSLSPDNWVMVDYEGTSKMVPIWQLLSDDHRTRKEELYKEVMRTHIYAFPVPILNYGVVVVKVGDFYVKDRNEGKSVPEVGAPLNYTNEGGHADHANSAFKGDYYTWEEAKKACKSPWRLPTKDELDMIRKVLVDSGNTYYIADQQGQRCYFPLSGASYGSSDAYADYWSSTEYNNDNAWYLGVDPNNSIVSMRYYGKSNGYSVRCVK